MKFFCPICGQPESSRERRPDGDSFCTAGHKYKSSRAITKKEFRMNEKDLADCIRNFIDTIKEGSTLDMFIAGTHLMYCLGSWIKEFIDPQVFASGNQTLAETLAAIDSSSQTFGDSDSELKGLAVEAVTELTGDTPSGSTFQILLLLLPALLEWLKKR